MLSSLQHFSAALRQYFVITLCYWVFTITDGALRMLVVLYFHQLGYSPLEVAMLFLFYEFFGVLTNLFGGWLASRMGLNITLNLGLVLQIVALCLLLVDPSYLSVAYVMFAQALSGIAKDLNKMSAKSAIKMLVKEDAQAQLYKWVAILTGSKNALKGAGFFVGAGLLSWIGFQNAMLAMALVLACVLVLSVMTLKRDMGKTNFKVKFKHVFSKSQPINLLSSARFFLFGSRDVWFVVALPVFLQSQLGWSAMGVGSLLAAWVIIYGLIQALAPKLTGHSKQHVPSGKVVLRWTFILFLMPLVLAWGVSDNVLTEAILWGGLLVYGAVFAINSAMHSYLIVAMADKDQVALDVGFYYMANAAGRLVGTVLSGWVYQQYGLTACLIVSSFMIAMAFMMTVKLQNH